MSVSTSLQRSPQNRERIYRFGKNQDGNALLASGWGEPENGFVWSEGKVAALSAPAMAGLTGISLSIWGYAPAKLGPQDVLIFVNGAFRKYVRAKQKAIVRIDGVAVADRDEIDIALYMPNATSPEIAEGTDDKRQLGIALAAVQLHADSEAA